MAKRIRSTVYLVSVLLSVPSIAAPNKNSPSWIWHAPTPLGTVPCDRETFKLSNGTLASCVLAEAKSFPVTPGGPYVICVADKLATFNPQGVLTSCTLNDDFRFKAATPTTPAQYVEASKPLCRAGQRASFDPKTGGLLNCQ